ncbi:MAG: hypothetical protein AABY22_22260, partial [Nanoarchaeota archaeon]
TTKEVAKKMIDVLLRSESGNKYITYTKSTPKPPSKKINEYPTKEKIVREIFLSEHEKYIKKLLDE